MLIQKCFVKPTSRNTPTGGSITESKIRTKLPAVLSSRSFISEEREGSLPVRLRVVSLACDDE